MVGAVGESRVLARTDAEGLDAHRQTAGLVDIGLGETGGAGRRTRLFAIGIKPVDAGECPELTVERLVLVEDHENEFHFFPQRADGAVLGRRAVAEAGIFIARERRDVRGRIGLRANQIVLRLPGEFAAPDVAGRIGARRSQKRR